MGILIIIAAVFMLYFLPAIAATYYNHTSSASITVINLFLGWTIIGWFFAIALLFKNLTFGQFLKALAFNILLFVIGFVLMVVGV